MEAVVTTGAIRYVKSSPPTNQHPTIYRPDALPVTRPTVPKALNHITWICLPQALPGSSNILLMNYSCFWHPYFGKFVRVTKFNKSTAFSQYIVNIQHYVYLKKHNVQHTGLLGSGMVQNGRTASGYLSRMQKSVSYCNRNRVFQPFKQQDRQLGKLQHLAYSESVSSVAFTFHGYLPNKEISFSAPPLNTQKQCTARGPLGGLPSLSLTTKGSWVHLLGGGSLSIVSSLMPVPPGGYLD